MGIESDWLGKFRVVQVPFNKIILVVFFWLTFFNTLLYRIYDVSVFGLNLVVKFATLQLFLYHFIKHLQTEVGATLSHFDFAFFDSVH